MTPRLAFEAFMGRRGEKGQQLLNDSTDPQNMQQWWPEITEECAPRFRPERWLIVDSIAIG